MAPAILERREVGAEGVGVVADVGSVDIFAVYDLRNQTQEKAAAGNQALPLSAMY
jgi:hypothetical protein